jgi:hypothetical protein
VTPVLPSGDPADLDCAFVPDRTRLAIIPNLFKDSKNMILDILLLKLHGKVGVL